MKNKIYLTSYRFIGKCHISFVKKNIKLLLTERRNINLENYKALEKWFKRNRPDYVINGCKAGVSRIIANIQLITCYLI